MTMAEKVYQARCRHRLTQVELAKRADVGQSVICKWLLLDSRGVDVLRLPNLILVILSSLKPLFFNGLKKELHFSDNVGA